MAESCRFDLERDVNKQRGNVSYDENDGTERLANFNWCTCSRCELREIAREYICCLQQPESESKFSRGTRTLIGSTPLHASVCRVKVTIHTTNNCKLLWTVKALWNKGLFSLSWCLVKCFLYSISQRTTYMRTLEKWLPRTCKKVSGMVQQ